MCYLPMWLATMALAAVLVSWSQGGSREAVLAASTATDDVHLWIRERGRLAAQGAYGVALIGASRIQVGVDLDTFAEVTGVTPVQLAINGNSPLPVLEHLAADPAFRGIVICSITGAGPDPTLNAVTARQWVAAYERRRQENGVPLFYADFEQALRRLGRLAIAPRPQLFLPERQLARLLGNDVHASDRTVIQMNEDRSMKIDYRGRSVAAAQAAAAPARRLDLAEYLKRARVVEPWVTAIQERGGKVVFVRFPSDGSRWARDQKLYPRSVYWSAFARQTEAATVHFADYPELSRFTLPDGSHLDYRDTVAFTRSLAQILKPLMER